MSDLDIADGIITAVSIGALIYALAILIMEAL